MTTQSDSIAQLATALAFAQGLIESVPKSKTAYVKSIKGNFSYKYATLADCRAAIRVPLASNGLAVLQMSGIEDGILSIESRLVHTSGEFISGTMRYPIHGLSMQELGETITYLRKYALSSMLGLATEDDRDGVRPAGEESIDEPEDQPEDQPTPDPMVAAKFAFLDLASKLTGFSIRSWADTLAWWGKEYDHPATLEEWDLVSKAFTREVKIQQTKNQEAAKLNGVAHT